jgi:hypothetical protein
MHRLSKFRFCRPPNCAYGSNVGIFEGPLPRTLSVSQPKDSESFTTLVRIDAASRSVETDAMELDESCIICLENESDAVLIECGHRFSLPWSLHLLPIHPCDRCVYPFSGLCISCAERLWSAGQRSTSARCAAPASLASCAFSARQFTAR